MGPKRYWPVSFSEFMHMLVANLLSIPFSGLFSVPFLMLLNRPPGLWDDGKKPNGVCIKEVCIWKRPTLKLCQGKP